MPDDTSTPHGRRRRIADHYEPRLVGRRPDHQVLDWASRQSQEARFEILVSSVDLRGRSLLDVGCGLGNLWEYLKRRRLNADYTGVDILEKMVLAARHRHGDGNFVQGDVFAGNVFDRTFHTVFCSGIFNLNLGNNRQFLADALPKLLALADNFLVFNLLHKRAAYQEDRYFYFEPSEVLPLVEGCPCQCRVIDDYLPNDFTVVCAKSAAK